MHDYPATLARKIAAVRRRQLAAPAEACQRAGASPRAWWGRRRPASQGRWEGSVARAQGR